MFCFVWLCLIEKIADFMGQRLTDNRRERGVALKGAMTKQEKQDNSIVIIQVPLKQKPKPVNRGMNNSNAYDSFGGFFGGAVAESAMCYDQSSSQPKSRSASRSKSVPESANVEVNEYIILNSFQYSKKTLFNIQQNIFFKRPP
jgi:hypothetical protein